MKNKTFGMFALSVIALALVLSSVSALTLTAPSSLTFTRTNSSQTLSVAGGNFTFTGLTVSSLSDQSGNLFPSAFSVTPVGTTSPVSSINLNALLTSNINSGTFLYGQPYSANLQINGLNATNSSDIGSTNVSLIYLKSFCSNGDINDSNLQLDVQITNNGEGSNDNQWLPLDEIQVQVTLENHGTTDLNDVYFKLGLFKANSNSNSIQNMIWQSGSDNEVSVGGINSGDSQKYTFDFKVDPSISSGSYILMAKAYSKDSGESNLCIDHSQDLATFGGSQYFSTINVQKQSTRSQMVIVDVNSHPAVIPQVSCGQQLTLTPTIYNIGSSDFKNQILVTLFNQELGINTNQTLYGTLTSGSNTQPAFTISVPQNANEGVYMLHYRTYYGYVTNNNGAYFGSYNYISQDTFDTPIQISGGCVYATSDTTRVTAQLVSGGNAGQPLVIQATVSNSGNRTATYSFGLEGYSSWASVSSLSPVNVTLAPGQSQDVTLTLNVNQNAAGGNQIFYLDTYSNGYLITKQPIQVPITSGFRLFSLTGSAISSSNWYIWAFGLLNIILVVVIIIVLVRIRSNKKSK